VRRARSRASSAFPTARASLQADLYDAPTAIAEPASFDLVFTTWASPAGCPISGDGRNRRAVPETRRPVLLRRRAPRGLRFDDVTKLADGRPGYFAPYFERQRSSWPSTRTTPIDGAFANATSVEWLHPLSDIVGGLIDAGLSLDWLHEHAQVRGAVRDAGKGRRRLALAGQQWLPLPCRCRAPARLVRAWAGFVKRASSSFFSQHRDARCRI